MALYPRRWLMLAYLSSLAARERLDLLLGARARARARARAAAAAASPPRPAPVARGRVEKKGRGLSRAARAAALSLTPSARLPGRARHARRRGGVHGPAPSRLVTLFLVTNVLVSLCESRSSSTGSACGTRSSSARASCSRAARCARAPPRRGPATRSRTSTSPADSQKNRLAPMPVGTVLVGAAQPFFQCTPALLAANAVRPRRAHARDEHRSRRRTRGGDRGLVPRPSHRAEHDMTEMQVVSRTRARGARASLALDRRARARAASARRRSAPRASRRSSRGWRARSARRRAPVPREAAAAEPVGVREGLGGGRGQAGR